MLERRFQPVLVQEPFVEQTIVILRGLRDILEAQHQVTFADEAQSVRTMLETGGGTDSFVYMQWPRISDCGPVTRILRECQMQTPESL